MRYGRWIAASAALAAAMLGFGGNGVAGDTMVGALTVSNPWARASAGAAPNGAAYLTIVNAGDQDDKLVAAETPAAARAELHTTIQEGDVMRMRPLEAVDIAPGASVTLAPGGMHLMLMGLTAPLEEGQSVPLTLTFEHAGKVTVEAMVMSAGAISGPMGHEGH
jgi:copper(I)-binding protein